MGMILLKSTEPTPSSSDWIASSIDRIFSGSPCSDITKEPLDFGAEGYIPFTDDTEPNFIGGEQTLGEFLRSDAPQEESEVMKLC